MRKRRLTAILILLSALTLSAPAASAQWDDSWSDDSWGDSGFDSGNSWSDRSRHRSDGFGAGWGSDYERGGLALDYFHTDQFFGREMRGFPDTAFGENSDYDAQGYGDSSRYNQRYDQGGIFSHNYGAFQGLSTKYGEGFVSGEGFGDEYIGDPDQLNEEIWTWD